MSFQYKGVKTHGIVSDDDGGGRSKEEAKKKSKSKEEKDWTKAVSGLRAEQRIFDQIETLFADEPCLLMNGFKETDLIKVVKSTLKRDKSPIEPLSDQVKINFYKQIAG